MANDRLQKISDAFDKSLIGRGNPNSNVKKKLMDAFVRQFGDGDVDSKRVDSFVRENMGDENVRNGNPTEGEYYKSLAAERASAMTPDEYRAQQDATLASSGGEVPAAEASSRQMDYKPASEQREGGGFIIDRKEGRPDLGGDNEDGGRIKAIQDNLIAKGYDLGEEGASGIYNKQTETAVKLVQKLMGKDETGIVDEEFYRFLIK